MATTNAKVSSASLSELQTKLLKLAGELERLSSLMNADMTNVNAYWDDPKYQEFKDCYSKQIKMCGDISEKYFAWCDTVLSKTIERVVLIETQDVGASIGGGGVSSASAGGTTAGGSAAAATSGISAGKANKFYTGNKGAKKVVLSRETGTPIGRDGKADIALETAQEINNAADALCANDPSAVGNIKIENKYEGDSYNVGGKAGVKASGFFKKVADVNIEGNGQYDSGKKTTNVVIEKKVDCSNFNK